MAKFLASWRLLALAWVCGVPAGVGSPEGAPVAASSGSAGSGRLARSRMGNLMIPSVPGASVNALTSAWRAHDAGRCRLAFGTGSPELFSRWRPSTRRSYAAEGRATAAAYHARDAPPTEGLTHVTRVALLPSAYPPSVGGVEELSRHLALTLREAGDEVEVWTSHLDSPSGPRPGDRTASSYDGSPCRCPAPGPDLGRPSCPTDDRRSSTFAPPRRRFDRTSCTCSASDPMACTPPRCPVGDESPWS